MNKFKLCLSLSCFFAAHAISSTLEGLPGTLFAPSAQPLGHLALSVGLGAYGQDDVSMIRNNLFLFEDKAKPGFLDTSVIQDMQSGTLRLDAAIGLGKYVDLGLTLPYDGEFIGDTKAKDLSGSGLGDPSIFFKAGYALAGDNILDVAVLGALTIPSKNPNGFLQKQPGYVPADSIIGPPHYFSSYGVGGSGRLLMTFDASRMETHPPFRANVGVGFSNSGAPQTEKRFLLGGSLEWLPLPVLGFFTNLQTETPFSKLDPQNIGKDMMIAGAGFTATSDDGIFFSVSIEKTLSNRPFHSYSKNLSDGVITYDARALPSMALALMLGWTGSLAVGDQDGDGIPDNEDLCPREPEDKDGFQDQDGCPDPDNDQDGIPDALDKCPNEPEDFDGFQDQDGCPDPDNDKDGIPDAQDKCPNEPEDKDGFEDSDGCPDIDNDKDGIPDLQDKCPNQAEDKDGFQDADGCPDPDNDGDKIPDIKDKCPNEPETYNGFEDADGCPDVVRGSSAPAALPPLEKRTILSKVHFLGNGSELSTDSYASLDTLALKLKAAPDVLVEIRGYMDNTGTETEQFKLSEARAIAVRKYLLNRGVPSTQALARGMGARDPIGSMHTAAGRAQNRRIEVFRLN